MKKYHGSLQRPTPIEIDGQEEYEVVGILTTADQAGATSIWYLRQVVMPPRASGNLSESCDIVLSC